MLRRSVSIPSSFGASALALGAIALGALPGCEYLLGMNGHDAVLATDSGSDATSDGTVDTGSDSTVDQGVDAGTDLGVDVPDVPDVPDVQTVCQLPTAGDAKVRFTNLVPSTDHYDLCLQASGSSSAPIGPIFGTSGADCPTGLQYKDSSALFAVAHGTYDISFVKSGSDCTATPAAKVTGVAINATTQSNVVLTGDGSGTFGAHVFGETLATGLVTTFTFIHASADIGNLDFSITTSTDLPTALQAPAIKNLAYGQTLPAGSSPAVGSTTDANGYSSVEVGGAPLTFGVAPTGSTAAIATITALMPSTTGLVLYAIGSKTQSAFPFELLVCNESTSDGVLAECGNALPKDVKFDEINAYFSGNFGPLDAYRYGYYASALAPLLQGDVVCVNELFEESLKTAVINAAASNYPNAARFQTTQATPLDDPTDQFGNTPAPRTNAACEGANATGAEAVVACVLKNCAEPLGIPTYGDGGTDAVPDTLADGALDPTQYRLVENGSACIESHCLSEVLPFLTSTASAEQKQCYSCMLTHWYDRESFSSQITDCETAPSTDPDGGAPLYPNPRLTFGGDNGAVVLSKYPIDNANVSYVAIAGTEFRQGFLRVPVIVSPQVTIDFYCGEIGNPPKGGGPRPYAGNYSGIGDAGTDAEGGVANFDTIAWANEQQLDAQRVGELVNKYSYAVGHRAVVAGEFFSGPASPSSMPALTALNPAAFTALTSELVLAAPASYLPSCTFCSANPIEALVGGAGGANAWGSLVFSQGVPITDVRGNAVVYSDSVIPFPTFLAVDAGADAEAGPTEIPLSTYYGFRSVIHVRP